MNINTFIAEFGGDFELLDAGEGEKLERWGDVVIRRPEPQAVWQKNWSENVWQETADIVYQAKGTHSGSWKKKNSCLPDKWLLNYRSGRLNLSFRLSLTAFKHLGLFPEQASNWEFIARRCSPSFPAKVLNLFAYTGGATLAAAQQSATVTHLDAVKQVVSWANENAALNKLDNIRWIVDDALKFAKREISRGKKYHGVILDPPAFGHGSQGERWKLEDQINELIHIVSQLLAPPPHFVVLNTYSLGFSPIILSNLMQIHFAPPPDTLAVGELCLPIQANPSTFLPLGITARYHRE